MFGSYSKFLKFVIFEHYLLNLHLSVDWKSLDNKLGWAEPHSRFPLGFPMIFPKGLTSNLSIGQIRGCWDTPLSLSIGGVWWDTLHLIFWGRLHFKRYSILIWSTLLKLKILGRSDQWLFRYSPFNNLRSSSICGRLPFKQYSILVLSPLIKFKIWGRSNQWLLRYFSFNIFLKCKLKGYSPAGWLGGSFRK
jgi:hypothetical protein